MCNGAFLKSLSIVVHCSVLSLKKEIKNLSKSSKAYQKGLDV